MVRSLLSLLFFGAIAIVGYGYFDAYKSHSASVDVLAWPITYWSVNYGSFDTAPLDKVTRGQVYIKLKYSRPADDRVVSRMRLSGSISEGNRKLEEFDRACQQGGSEFLGSEEQYIDSEGHITCFIKLRTIFPFDDKAHGGAMDKEAWAMEDRIKALKLEYSLVEVRARNRPMKYVVWINNQVSRLEDYLMSPFERS